MLSLYERFKESLWCSPDPDSTCLGVASSSGSSSSADSPRERSLTDDNVLPGSDDLHQRFFTGHVTSVTEESGMINDHVFFDMGVVVGGVQVEVGDLLHVQACRSHSKAGWRAVRVEVTSKWLTEGESYKEVLIGYISGMGGRRGVVSCENQEISFPSEIALGYGGYRPHVNDWVKVFILHQDEEMVVSEVRPLRERAVLGEVTQVTHGYGTIDEDIHFTMSSCCHGYFPTTGEQVKADCVEYKHHRNNWRAFYVTPNGPSTPVTPNMISTQDTNSESIPSKVKPGSIPIPDVSIPKPIIPLLSGVSGRLTLEDLDNQTAATSTPSHTTTSLLLPSSPFIGLASGVSSVIQERGSYQDKLAACRLPGQRPLKLGFLKLYHKLKGYPIPEELRACLEVEMIEPTLEEPLCLENYEKRFSSLLYVEEVQREKDIRVFDMDSVTLKQCGPYLSLQVPGLAEGRPSLLMGDRAIVCQPGGDELVVHWEGYIHEVRGGDVLLKFADTFHDTFNNQNYDVMFTFNRTQFRRMHHAVELGYLIGPRLFPGKPIITPSRLCVTKWFNSSLNSRQKAAVTRILGAQCSHAPYVVFGPPGTGKTVTLVEAVLQIHFLTKSSRVLVCAPSNSAADLLTERISQGGVVSPGVLTRLNAIQRAMSNVSSLILKYCKDVNSADTAVRSRIVVATCSTAGMLHGLGLGVGHFSHVIVDEAGQATEPECLLPLSLMARSNKGQIVLAGDPCQLGPVLASRLAGRCGLGLSLLERLMERPAYQRDESRFKDHGHYDPLVVTKLIHNYRSHQHLLKMYSEMFYEGELEVCAAPSKTDVMLRWEGLPNKGFPLLFHGILGEDMQEGNSPSWFNPVEALQVVKYIQALKDNATFAPILSELSVITPYRKQVEKIRQLLVVLGCGEGSWGGVKVGSVEEFQGQERTAVIISTVRSSADLMEYDDKHHLGFLSNPKRFNVAISRACALLVVVGNPLLLKMDPYWSKLLDYAIENEAYTGCKL